MAMSEATKRRRMASLEAGVTAARQVARGFREKAEKADAQAVRLGEELAWLRDAPTSDQPAPSEEGTT
jgi:hypothetical protein